ncbi:putative HTH-type transcriptional regulator YyaN [Paenibacillus baekrokdamisoli]|uniref:Putative HTH-type transcriptional regulator YyaN n=1 Tax=Paenibacillus baekrokdamisoli TaxID=1712516 RepID=A0A3G9IVM3_9BACL|nr:MerR family transcriptional regulator [Paenibacillus baekrokdamisoli]MBB3068086.1 DNA-binding transcriptional MerR regulator [Paenibacillus baekrokdamisoli]BBH22870.1 putative HTH-type transcriptional regulator YyaN [Paenibacillus baekrokdamisoli]
MYSIGEMSKLTGITAFTLRYYEKVGVLPQPSRQNGVRRYDDQDLQFIRFIHGLKETGMGLEDIAAFTEDGCLLHQSKVDEDEHEGIREVLQKRLLILNQHIVKLEQHMRQLEKVKAVAQEKTAYYSLRLQEQQE